MGRRVDEARLDLTVQIINWNLDRELRQAIDSLLETASGLEYEAFITDNNSQEIDFDNIIDSYSNKDRLHFIKKAHNNGALVLNDIKEHIRGRYLLTLGPDTILRNDALQRLVNFMDSHNNAGAATGKLLNPDGTPQLYYFRLWSISMVFWVSTVFGTLVDRLLFSGKKRRFYLGLDVDVNSVTELEQPPGACLIIRMGLLEKDEYIVDPIFPFYYNDVDLCRRIQRKGYKIYLVPTAEVVHIGGAAFNKAGSLWKRRESIRSQIQYFRKYHRERVWLLKTMRIFDQLLRIVAAPVIRRKIMAQGERNDPSLASIVIHEINMIRAIILS